MAAKPKKMGGTMRWLLFVMTAFLLSGCYVPTPFSVATFGIDAVSYFVSGKTATDHGISLAMDQDCALIRVLEGEVCVEDGMYEIAAYDEALAPLPEDPDVARLTGASEAVVASAERAAAVMAAPQETTQLAGVSDRDLRRARAGANRGERGEAGAVAFPVIPRAKPLPPPEPITDVATAARDGEAERVEIVQALLLEGLITDEAIVTAAGPAVPDDGGDVDDVTSARDGGDVDDVTSATEADTTPNKHFGRSRWSEVGESVTVMARHGSWSRLNTILLGAAPKTDDWPDTRA